MKNTEIYFAPLEGITGYVFRNAYENVYGGITKYFSPFIAMRADGRLRTKEKNDILPEHNDKLVLIPQILAHRSVDFLSSVEKISDFGYTEVNLNLGCPSGTVVSKGRGAGMLKDTEKLNRFLDEIYERVQVKVSIKTRIGFDKTDEWEELLTVFNRYPIAELIIHPRTKSEFYQGAVHEEAFSYAYEISKCPVVFNGEVNSLDECMRLGETYPSMPAVMLGRGLLRHPGMTVYEDSGAATKRKFATWLEQLCIGYEQVLSGERDVLFKMKELWFYIAQGIPDSEKELKTIRKSKNLLEYRAAVKRMLEKATGGERW